MTFPVLISATNGSPINCFFLYDSRTMRPSAQVSNGMASLETVARAVGIVNAERMRRAFVRLYSQPPQAPRRIAGAQAKAFKAKLRVLRTVTYRRPLKRPALITRPMRFAIQ